MPISFCVRHLIFIFGRYHSNWQFKQVFCYKIACYAAIFQVIVLEKKQVKEKGSFRNRLTYSMHRFMPSICLTGIGGRPLVVFPKCGNSRMKKILEKYRKQQNLYGVGIYRLMATCLSKTRGSWFLLWKALCQPIKFVTSPKNDGLGVLTYQICALCRGSD